MLVWLSTKEPFEDRVWQPSRPLNRPSVGKHWERRTEEQNLIEQLTRSLDANCL